MDRAAGVRAGAGHFDQGAGGRGPGGNCLRRVSRHFDATTERPRFPAALALSVAAIIGSSWYLAVEHSRPGFLHDFFECHVRGFLTDSQPHGQAPRRYYFPILIVGGIPWIGYLPVLFEMPLAARGSEYFPSHEPAHRPLPLLACWFIGCTLFLTVSRSKLVTYIWPVFPAMAILAAIVWARKIDGVLSDGAKRWMGRIVWFTCLIGPLGLRLHWPSRNRAGDAVLAAGMDVGSRGGADSLAPLWSWLRGRDRLTLELAAATVCGQLVVLGCAFPQVAEGLSGRDLADYFNRTRELPSRMLMVQEQIGSVIFYLDRDLRSQLQLGQMRTWISTTPCPCPRWARRNGSSSPSVICTWR